MQRPRRTLLLTVVAIVLSSADARAVLIKFETSGIVTGSLNFVPFSNQTFSITSIANTSQVQDLPFALGVNNLSTTIQLGSTSLTTFAGSSYVNKAPSAISASFFYSTANVGDEFDISNTTLYAPEFFGYELNAPLGPLVPTNPYILAIPTNQGDLDFRSYSNVQFTASIVPEPATLALTVPAAFALLRRRPRCHAPRGQSQ